MRQLTFRGFLAQYVRALSGSETSSLYRLAREAERNNPRLREPLLLYALYSGKQTVLLQATRHSALYAEYSDMMARYSAEKMTQSLAARSPSLPEGYHKVWSSYQSLANKKTTEARTKELMRKKIRQLQEKYGVSNYRVYTDLGLNAGNLNAWLKNGESSKVSLETARRTLRYLENTSRQ